MISNEYSGRYRANTTVADIDQKIGLLKRKSKRSEALPKTGFTGGSFAYTQDDGVIGVGFGSRQG
jgi:hypothetical protein